MYKIYRFNLDKKSFGRTLSKLMKEHGITIEKLSTITMLDVNTIKKWRSGERIPSLEMINSLAKRFNVSMHALLMPESLYNAPFSDELLSYFNNRTIISNLSPLAIEEIKQYSEYLFQKMLFSFPSFKEQRDLKSLLPCFKLTQYGIEKLNLHDYSFSQFYSSVRSYVQQEYGKHLPYIINKEKSEEIYSDFERMISFKLIGGENI